MREFIDIVESNEGDTVTLYRGDNTKIDQFDMSKTDPEALLGVGIYLTDDPSVAADYTIKERGDDSIVFRSKNENRPDTPQALTAEFLRSLANPGYDPRREGKPGELGQRIADEKAYWEGEYRERSKHLDWTDKEARQAIQDEVLAGFQKRKSEIIRKAVEKAKVEFKKLRPELRMIRLTTGEYVFTKKQREGVVSTFEVPKEYVARCLDVERPLPDDLLPVIKDAFTRAHHKKDPNGEWDLRYWNKDGSQNMGNTFDNFVKGFKEHGTFYAWSDNNDVGGKGQNPSLDHFWNGTHSGYHVFQNDRDKQMALIDALKKKGYVGYFYDGGVRLAGTMARGGGGLRHNAYVFWDDKAINSFRKDHIVPQDDAVDDFSKGLRANKVWR